MDFAILCQLTIQKKVVKYYPSKNLTLNALSTRGFMMLQQTQETNREANARLSIDKIQNTSPDTCKLKKLEHGRNYRLVLMKLYHKKLYNKRLQK